MTKYRSIFISDVHLGTRGSNAKALNNFLKNNSCDYLYLVGDIIDGWRLKQNFYWPESHNKVIKRILSESKNGTKVFYITGNHDEFLRSFTPKEFGNIKIYDRIEHNGLNGKKYLIIHGDDFDGIVKYHKWVALLGDWGYSLLIHLNRWFNNIQSIFGLKKWSLSKYIKYQFKQAMKFIYNFEHTVAHECKNQGYDGIFVGHIHYPELKTIEGIEYFNTGDWVENCSAIVEDFKGNFYLKKDLNE